MKIEEENYKYEELTLKSPDIGSFIKHRYWGIHEAAFLLTAWPKKGLYECDYLQLAEDVKNDRPFFYLPTSLELDLKMYGKAFETMFMEIKDAIEYFHLIGHHQYLCCGVTYLVSPQDVVVWALMKEKIIPSELQEAFEIYQSIEKPRKQLREKVKNKIKGQFYFSRNPTDPIDLACKEINGNEKDITAIRNHLNELFDSKGKPGRRPLNSVKSSRSYVHKAIPEILTKEHLGKQKYQFTLLKEAMTTAVFEKMKLMDKKELCEMTKERFFDEFRLDVVVELYLRDASEILVNFVREIAEDNFSRYQRAFTPSLSQQLKALQSTDPGRI